MSKTLMEKTSDYSLATEHSVTDYMNRISKYKTVTNDTEVEKKDIMTDFMRLDRNILEKIGFALRCYHALSDLSVTAFERDDYEVYFGLACLTAGAYGENRETDAQKAKKLINNCIEICCGKEDPACESHKL